MIIVRWRFFGHKEGSVEKFETLEDFEWWYSHIKGSACDIDSIDTTDPELDEELEWYRTMSLH